MARIRFTVEVECSDAEALMLTLALRHRRGFAFRLRFAIAGAVASMLPDAALSLRPVSGVMTVVDAGDGSTASSGGNDGLL